MAELNEGGGQLERSSTNQASVSCPQSVRQVLGVFSPNPAPGPAVPAKPDRARPGDNEHVQDLVGLPRTPGQKDFTTVEREERPNLVTSKIIA